ncbi:hypothetical protein V3C99_010967, partial [Haemonchus contortus]
LHSIVVFNPRQLPIRLHLSWPHSLWTPVAKPEIEKSKEKVSSTNLDRSHSIVLHLSESLCNRVHHLDRSLVQTVSRLLPGQLLSEAAGRRRETGRT